jgi:hypothetical protein
VTPKTRRALIGGAVVAIAGAIAFEWLWTSDEERVVAALDALQSALEHRDMEAAEKWLLADVPFPAGVPGIPAGGKINEGLARVFERIDTLKLRRDKTDVKFDDDGAATVTSEGTGRVETKDVGGFFSFDLEARFQKQPDQRFLLERVGHVHFDFGLH